MTELTLGALRIVSDGMGVSLWTRDSATPAATLDIAEVDQLIEFLVCHALPGGNRRQLFRVPLSPESGLSVRVHVGDATLATIPRNISLTGMLVELADPEGPPLALDDRVKVVLEFEGTVQTRVGVVCRCTERGYGLLFVESLETEEVLPPPALATLVMQLQRRWSARRRLT